MIELTPLDVRKKKGDFRRGLRGYEPQQVDDFLDIVADRFEAVVREAASVRERVSRLEQQVAEYRDREKALTEALVTAQQMREDMRTQSTREVEIIRKQAEQEADSIKAGAVNAREREEEALHQLRSRQIQFLASYRTFLEQELADLHSMARAFEVYGSGVAAAAQRPPVRPAGGSAAPSHGSAAKGPAFPPSAGPSGTPVPSAPGGAPPIRESARPVKDNPVPAPAKPVSTTKAAPTTPRSQRGASDELDAQLEKALARWEPELERTPAEVARAGAAALEDDETDIDESPDALADELEFLLSDDDMVGGAKGAAGPGSSVPEARGRVSPPSKVTPPTMQDSDDLEAELAELLATEDDEEDDFEIELENVPDAADAPSAIDPMGDEESRAEVTTAMSDSGHESMIDLDDAFPEPPGEAEDIEREPTFDELLKAAVRPDDTGDEAGPGTATGLDSYGMSQFDPGRGAGNEVDTSGLTLHPMFFDQDSPDLPGALHPSEEKRKEDRHDRWSGGDEG